MRGAVHGTSSTFHTQGGRGMRTLAISLGLVFLLAAAAQAQAPSQVAFPTPPEDRVMAFEAHTCSQNVEYYEADYDLDGSGHVSLALFGPLLKTPRGMRKKGPAQVALPFGEGGRPSGEAYVIVDGQLEQMNLMEFVGRYPTPCTFFGDRDLI